MNSNFDRLSAHLNRYLNKRVPWLWVGAVLWLTTLTGISLWLHLGSTGLVDETEPLFAEAARQMLVRGDWVTPYFNEATRFDKPPLVYWIMVIAYQVMGVNEWAVRFPSALAATGLTIAGFLTLRQFGVTRPIDAATPAQLRLSAWIGSALIVLNLQTIAWGRIGVSDMLLSGCLGGALLAFFWGYAAGDLEPSVTRQNRQKLWYLAFWGLCGLAVLAKGPVGIVLPGLIIAAFGLYLGNWRSLLQEMPWLSGILLFLAIILPWHILVIIANGEAYIESFFGYHNVERFTRVVNNHWAPIWFYFAIVPISFFPWTAYLPIAISRLRFWQPQRWRNQARSTHLGLFALIWFAVIFGFFTIAATKLPSYTIPLLPAAGILVGLFWSDQLRYPVQSGAVRWSHAASIGLAVLLAGALWLSPRWLGNEPEMPQLAEVIQQSGIIHWGAALWLLVAGCELVLLLRRQGQWIWSVRLLGFVGFLLMTLLPAMTILDTQRQLPLRQLAATIEQVHQPNEPIVMIGYRKPSLVFYTHRPILYIAAPGDVPEQMQKLTRRLSRPRSPVRSLLILGRPVKLREAGIQPDQYETIAAAGVHRLGRMTVQPRRKSPSAPSSNPN
ncbi:MAG: glycosyltransferase family 39 protein [Elainella sp. Prado103]|nr:glycosyltransferase family 39 protein [Elainella sp. Prado103]